MPIDKMLNAGRHVADLQITASANSAATSAEISSDQPSATLKQMTRTGLEYCPSSKSSMTFSTLAVSTSLSQ
jgi:hypothetical protein